ncbi:MAG: hypothetical protein EZS28_010836 [Streblomastix strix]|uniref:Uncharacterized protein n=1 Tax=Streblomastix strix TaxID=222440 RepID=A0A5J4WGY9_9EUKA|nr:MAG: hypothetical protein EZS28_010836 [Streblomastix strix]
MLCVYKLPLGTRLRKQVAYFNNHGITVDIELDFNKCSFVVTSFALHPDINNNKSRIADAVQLFFKFHDQEYIIKKGNISKTFKQQLQQYDGYNQATDLDKFQSAFKLNVFTYEFDGKTFSKTNEFIVDKEYINVHILVVSQTIDDDVELHAMFIKDLDLVVGGKLCEKCNQNYSICIVRIIEEIFERHMFKCQGPISKKKVRLDYTPKAFVPHLQDNKYIQNMYALYRQDELKPTTNFITYDFETIEEKTDKSNDVLAQLSLLSVASAAHINCVVNTQYYDKRDGDDFIIQWLNQLFELVRKANDANEAGKPFIFENAFSAKYQPKQYVQVIEIWDSRIMQIVIEGRGGGRNEIRHEVSNESNNEGISEGISESVNASISESINESRKGCISLCGNQQRKLQ